MSLNRASSSLAGFDVDYHGVRICQRLELYLFTILLA